MARTYYVVEIFDRKLTGPHPLVIGITHKLKKAAKLADKTLNDVSDGVEVIVTRYSCNKETGEVGCRCCLTGLDLREALESA